MKEFKIVFKDTMSNETIDDFIELSKEQYVGFAKVASFINDWTPNYIYLEDLEEDNE